MRKELLWKTIWELQLMMLKLNNSKTLLIEEISGIKQEKNCLNIELGTINRDIENWTKRNNEVEEISLNLNSKRTELQDKIDKSDSNVALLHIKEQEIIQNIRNSAMSLNKWAVTLVGLNEDISILKKEKISIQDSNIAIIQDNINKKKEKEIIQKDIDKFSLILSDINRNIEDFNTREDNLNKKENHLLIKASRLIKKESRLNDFKKDLLSKK